MVEKFGIIEILQWIQSRNSKTMQDKSWRLRSGLNRGRLNYKKKLVLHKIAKNEKTGIAEFYDKDTWISDPNQKKKSFSTSNFVKTSSLLHQILLTTSTTHILQYHRFSSTWRGQATGWQNNIFPHFY